MKYILGIQTAEFPNEVALVRADSTLAASVKIKEREQTIELLSKSVNQLISKRRLEIEDIDLVAVCLGPGSYTGTRGGVAFAKGLCQFRPIPLIGISAFEVLRENIFSSKKVDNVCYLLDARNERVFYIESQKDGKFIKVDYLGNILKGVDQKCTFIGSGATEYKEIIKKVLKDQATFITKEKNMLSAESVAKVGLKFYKKHRSIFSKDYLYKVKPLYILPPSITKPSIVNR